MSRTRLQVTLSPTEDQTLLELRKSPTIPQRTKDRAVALRLNHRGWTTEQIAEYLDWQVASVRRTIHRWHNQGLSGLWDSNRSGRPRKWSEPDMAYLEETIATTEATLNSRQLVDELEQARGVSLSRRHLRRLLKKKGIAGNELDTVISANKTH